ncbi:hypothetical protein RB628_07350 [Streptomyces sp. ADMS]|uniref:hypothetical protein n=1 Tax=Streptomyces sp. ADMS TaxID=3071415 RepID=UPI00296FAD44|nr:hypothetical protein [Streptomyces sp. ADMS]MDW4905166.1 hypothetical protein [Streptomyces sp. ADMS]
MSSLNPDRGALLRALAILSGALAVALYCWGLLQVLGAALEAEDGGTDSAPVRPCRTAGPQERGGAEVVDYSVGYVPLRFVCETRGGGSYATDSVPGYVNPGAFGFALAGGLLAVGAGYEAELRARRAATPPGEQTGTTS